jgi:hypothetical protein
MNPMSNRSGHNFTDFQISGAARAHIGDNYTIAQGKFLNSFGQYLYNCLSFVHPF